MSIQTAEQMIQDAEIFTQEYKAAHPETREEAFLCGVLTEKLKRMELDARREIARLNRIIAAQDADIHGDDSERYLDAKERAADINAALRG